MMIQGKSNTIINVLDKKYMTFTNKNGGVVDVREILGEEQRITKKGKKYKVIIYADYRPQRTVLNPDSLKPTVIDIYHELYGQNF